MTLHPALLRALDPLREAPERSAVVCDVDGTLAPIVARPEQAELAEGAREALTALRGRMGLVAFISGRALQDVIDLVGLPGYAYAGNHGMEICHAGGSPALAPDVERHLPDITAFAGLWPAERTAPGGVRLEVKGATLSYHARGAADPEAAAALLDAIAADAHERGLVARRGRGVMEIRPDIRIDKGTALRSLLARSGTRRAVYFGDDTTDIDGWRALSELRDEGVLEVEVSVAVDSEEVAAAVRESADHLVAGPEEVVMALDHLATPLQGR